MDRRTFILLCCYKFVTAVGFRQINKLGNKHNFGQEIIKYFPNRKVARAGRFNIFLPEYQGSIQFVKLIVQ